uniref:Uncharacterized protein n=1 Tax=Spironucleus salmonicida TaxID=348837 RepID=V6LVH5_9EUKA|eukprot:EST44809.1 Hypothetical protein SS50377_15254 [Spironucleus salmonicida]
MIQNGTIQGTVLKKSIQIKYNKSFIFDQIINNYIVFKTETSTILINLETYEEYSLAMSTNIISINSFVFVRLKSKTRQFSLTSFLSLFTQNDRTLKQVLKDNTHLMLLYNKMEIVKNFILEQANQLLDIYFVKQEESQSCQQLEIDKLSQKKTQLLFEHKILQHELIQQINQYNLDLRELQFTKARNKK